MPQKWARWEGLGYLRVTGGTRRVSGETRKSTDGRPKGELSGLKSRRGTVPDPERVARVPCHSYLRYREGSLNPEGLRLRQRGESDLQRLPSPEKKVGRHEDGVPDVGVYGDRLWTEGRGGSRG